MTKKILSLSALLFIVGFTFFYTNKAVIIARRSDPIMMKIIDVESSYKIDKINPTILKDEYIYGLNGCVVDEDTSYNKMKSVGSFDENLIYMKEEKIEKNTNDKYIISGNKENKNISIILIVKDKVNENLLEFIISKKIQINFFVESSFLEKNLEYIENLSKYGNIYNFGRNQKYTEKYISYDNNLIESITNNKSTYCLTDKKDSDILSICNKNSMEVIKSNYLNEEILSNIKYTLSNGKILVIDNINDNVLNIKVSINYIISKGYNIVLLNNLLKTDKNCDIIPFR